MFESLLNDEGVLFLARPGRGPRCLTGQLRSRGANQVRWCFSYSNRRCWAIRTGICAATLQLLLVQVAPHYRNSSKRHGAATPVNGCQYSEPHDLLAFLHGIVWLLTIRKITSAMRYAKIRVIPYLLNAARMNGNANSLNIVDVACMRAFSCSILVVAPYVVTPSVTPGNIRSESGCGQ